jgi:hypothetical protein
MKTLYGEGKKKTERSPLEFIRLKIFHQYLFLWLDLQKFEQKAQKFGRSLIPVNASNKADLKSLVDKTFGWYNAQIAVIDCDRCSKTDLSVQNSAPSSKWIHRFGYE